MCASEAARHRARRRPLAWLPKLAVVAALGAAVAGAAVADGGWDTSGAAGGASHSVRSASTGVPIHVPHHRVFQLRPALVPPGERAFAGEGEWRALATAPDGEPLVQGAMLRAGGTSNTAAVAWIRQSAARFELHPGYNQPGGSWSQPDNLPRDRREGLVATWNGGFLMGDSMGGFYLDGKLFGSLVDGVAAEVFFRDGSMTVGVWGRDVSMSPNVAGVRQQRRLMIDGGRIASDIDSLFTWGVTDGGNTYVRRSGVGVTADGDLVYAIGPVLSPRSLAEALRQAGAVRAMELDINISWPSFMAYDPAEDPTNPRPFKWGDFPRSAERYYSPSARDFVAVYARGATGRSCVDLDGARRGVPGGSGGVGLNPVAC
jgi:hypothetical protein